MTKRTPFAPLLLTLACLAPAAWAQGSNEAPSSTPPTESSAQGHSSPGVVDKVEAGVTHGVRAAASGVERGVKAAARGVAIGVKAAASGVERGARATAHAVEKVASKVTGSSASSPEK